MAVRPEINYPKPLKGQRVTCMGCKKGKVMTAQGLKNCTACSGKGFFVAK